MAHLPGMLQGGQLQGGHLVAVGTLLFWGGCFVGVGAAQAANHCHWLGAHCSSHQDERQRAGHWQGDHIQVQVSSLCKGQMTAAFLRTPSAPDALVSCALCSDQKRLPADQIALHN